MRRLAGVGDAVIHFGVTFGVERLGRVHRDGGGSTRGDTTRVEDGGRSWTREVGRWAEL
jgi:hypothetical protein